MLSVIPYVISAIFAITLHEAAHGIAALYFGDKTAKYAGRVSLNPVKHLDLFGTIILPAFLFLSKSPYIIGWAKPVPVDFLKLTPPRIGIICVAAAGPLMNLFLAWMCAILFHINSGVDTLGNDILITAFRLNIGFAIFNLLPIPPLDGGRILVAILPKNIAYKFAKIENYSQFILIGILLLPLIFHLLKIPFNPLEWIFYTPYITLVKLILFLSYH